MTVNEFKEALKNLGYDVEYGVSSYYVVRGNDTFAKISRRYERTIDTYHSPISNLNDKDGTALLAVVFEFASTQISEREDNDYRVYTMCEESEFVGRKLYVADYGADGKKIILDDDIYEVLAHPKATAEIIAERVSKVTGKKFELEKVER
jgi:hypothetical protein|nr:MAG TPA: hypothetical protein [Caudoviricetes sp.]